MGLGYTVSVRGVKRKSRRAPSPSAARSRVAHASPPIPDKSRFSTVFRHKKRGTVRPPWVEIPVARPGGGFQTQPRSFMASTTRSTATTYAACRMLMLYFLDVAWTL